VLFQFNPYHLGFDVITGKAGQIYRVVTDLRLTTAPSFMKKRPYGTGPR